MVAVDQNGTLFGQVASIDTQTKAASGLNGINVFFVRDGQVIKQTQTQSDGSFQVHGIQEGAYSFFAAGKSGFAAYGVYVTSHPNSATQNLLDAAIASLDYNGIEQLMQSNVPQQVRNSVANSFQSPAGTSIQSTKQVRLINGRLSGQINSMLGSSQMGSGVQVQLIQNNQPVAQVETNSQGEFSIPDVEPGVYDYIIAAQNGFAAGRFEAVGNNPNPMTQIVYRKMTTRLVASLTLPSKQLEQPIDYAMEPSFSVPVEYAGESIAYGGASGGSSGVAGNYSNFSGGGVVRGRFGGGRFGRGAGGGGGLGRLLMLGGIAGGIVAIADDDPNAASNSNN